MHEAGPEPAPVGSHSLDPFFRMHAERTPNPHSVKWVVSCVVAPGAGFASFCEAPTAETSPLAAGLFGVEGVRGVLLGPDFVTVSKDEEREWADLAPGVVAQIRSWVASGDVALGPEWRPAGDADSGSPGDGADVVRRIREILERDIRPYVLQDGGEIVFAGFESGVVQVYLRGACAGCPSSAVTLKMGIEARLKQEIPEVEAVIAL